MEIEIVYNQHLSWIIFTADNEGGPDCASFNGEAEEFGNGWGSWLGSFITTAGDAVFSDLEEPRWLEEGSMVWAWISAATTDPTKSTIWTVITHIYK